MPKRTAELDRQMGDRAPKVGFQVTPIARFSQFPYDILARYINHKVEFSVAHWPGADLPWEVRKLT